MSNFAIRSVYLTALELTAPTNSGSNSAALLLRDAWAEWIATLLARRAASHHHATGEEQTIDFDPSRLGKQVPIAGMSIETDWWESIVDGVDVRFGRFSSRDFQGEGRFWRTDIVVVSRGEQATVSLQMGIESTEFRVQPLGWQVGAPGFWALLARRLGCSVNGERTEYGGVTTHAAGEIDSLINRIASPHRRMPIVVVSVENWSGATSIDPKLAHRISRELFGLAHIHLLADAEAAWELTDGVGSEHGCYNGAVRIYWPGFDRNRAPDFRTLLIPDRIAIGTQSASQAATAVSLAVLRKIAPVTTFRFVMPGLINEIIETRRQELRNADTAKLRNELASSVDATAMGLIEDALRSKDEQHAQEIASLQQQLADTHAHYSKQLSAEQPEEDADKSESSGEIVVEYFASSSGRRPVLDFAEDEFPKDREDREKYLESLTMFAPRWMDDAGGRFEKITGATITTRAGRREDLWEYKAIKSQGEWVRVLFALIDGRHAILLHTVSKRQNRLDKGEIDTAKERLKEYLR